jgi:hypothetical protein
LPLGRDYRAGLVNQCRRVQWTKITHLKREHVLLQEQIGSHENCRLNAALRARGAIWTRECLYSFCEGIVLGECI